MFGELQHLFRTLFSVIILEFEFGSFQQLSSPAESSRLVRVSPGRRT